LLGERRARAGQQEAAQQRAENVRNPMKAV